MFTFTFIYFRHNVHITSVDKEDSQTERERERERERQTDRQTDRQRTMFVHAVISSVVCAN